MTTESTGIQKNEVVMLSPITAKNRMFAGCFMVVTDIKSWGVQGYVQALGQGGLPGGAAYYRASWDEFETLDPRASAPFIIQDEE